VIAQGFADPVLSGQKTFRALMDAMARPGSIHAIDGIKTAPAALGPTMSAVALSLIDHETTIHLERLLGDDADVRAFLAFHTSAPRTSECANADFALVPDGLAMPDLASFKAGTDAYPDRSTTLLIGVAGFHSGRRYTLSGPGIDGVSTILLEGARADLAAQLFDNRQLFPRGVDLIFCAPGEIMALPRSTRISEA
jgi:alpha-D-ribose 1-methylphosphonate 5-triphosphate synthase subunit PhnH